MLYSCAVQLPTWVPEFIITFLTKTALVEVNTHCISYFCVCVVLEANAVASMLYQLNKINSCVCDDLKNSVMFDVFSLLSIQATTWVRQESEKLAADPVRSSEVDVFNVPDVRSCFKSNDISAWYETSCSEVEQSVENTGNAESNHVAPRKRKMRHKDSAPSSTPAGSENNQNSFANRITSFFFQSVKAPSDLATKESAEIVTSVGTAEDLERVQLSYERFKMSNL